MIKKLFSLVCALILCMSIALCESPYWTEQEQKSSACKESRIGCQALQMVLYGHFSTLDTDDSLNLRVLSAVLPLLCSTDESDFEHFCAEFGVEYTTAQQLYYIALGNCLWADILSAVTLDESQASARRILLLFLDPSSQTDGPAQIASIRKVMTEEDIRLIADTAALPYEFVYYLMHTPDWNIPQ